MGSTSCKTYSNAGECTEAGYQVNARYEGIIIIGTPKKLDLSTLSYRRIRGDLIETYKILTGKYDPNVSSILPLNNNFVCRGHKKKIYKRRPRLDIRKYSFCYRIVDIWNRLPSEIVEAKSVYSFERRLYKFFKD